MVTRALENLPTAFDRVVEELRQLHENGVAPDTILNALRAISPANQAVGLELESGALSSARMNKLEVLVALRQSERLIRIPYSQGSPVSSTHIGGVEWHTTRWADLRIGSEDGKNIHRNESECKAMSDRFEPIMNELYGGQLASAIRRNGNVMFVVTRIDGPNSSETSEALAVGFRIPQFNGTARLIVEMPVATAERVQQLVRQGELTVGDVLRATFGAKFVNDFNLGNLRLSDDMGCANYMKNTFPDRTSITYPEGLNGQ